MSQDWQQKLVRRLKRWAMERFPLPFPVRVYLRPTSKMDRHLGFFEFDFETDRGIIALCEAQGREGLIDTFLEEYAHARCSHLIDTEDNDEDPHHHPSFWAEYGRLVKASREIEW